MLKKAIEHGKNTLPIRYGMGFNEIEYFHEKILEDEVVAICEAFYLGAEKAFRAMNAEQRIKK